MLGSVTYGGEKTRRERFALPVKFENVHQEASTKKKVSGFSPQMSERGGSQK